MQYNGRFLEVSREQRKMKISSSRAFPIRTYLQRRYSKNRRKLQFSLLRSSWFFLPSIKIAQLVSDIKQHHMTNTYHNDYDCWRFSVQSIDNGSFIHSRAFARESVCLYTRHTVTNSWKRRTDGKFCAAKQSLSICMYTYIQILHTLLYVCCNSSCRMVYKVVSMTQIPHLCSSCRSEIFLGYLMKQVVGWYI